MGLAEILSGLIAPRDALVLGGSAAVVLAMIAAAALLGFRQSARLDETMLAALAAKEDGEVCDIVFGAGARAALARLSNGKLLAARVMGDGVSARASAAARVELKGGRVAVRFDDIGYPPLVLSLAGPAPAWLDALARGRA